MAQPLLCSAALQYMNRNGKALIAGHFPLHRLKNTKTKFGISSKRRLITRQNFDGNIFPHFFKCVSDQTASDSKIRTIDIYVQPCKFILCERHKTKHLFITLCNIYLIRK